MKYTSIERFDGSCLLVGIPSGSAKCCRSTGKHATLMALDYPNSNFVIFDSLNDLQKYVDQEKIEVNIQHLHGAGRNIRVNGR